MPNDGGAIVHLGMGIISRILSPQQCQDPHFINDQEAEVMLEIAIFIAGRVLQEGEVKRITRHAVTDNAGSFVIFWDGVRKGLLYSGLELDRKPGETDPPVWLIFYAPEEDLQ